MVSYEKSDADSEISPVSEPLYSAGLSTIGISNIFLTLSNQSRSLFELDKIL